MMISSLIKNVQYAENLNSHSHRSRLFCGGPDGPEPDVAEPDCRVRLLRLDVGRNSGSRRARPAGDAGLARVRRRRVVRIEPELKSFQVNHFKLIISS